MHFVFFATVLLVSAIVPQICPTLPLESSAETAADVIAGCITLGFGFFIHRLPPEE
jgi:hypothetical protein